MQKTVEKLLETIATQIIRGEREGRLQIDKNETVYHDPYHRGTLHVAMGSPTGIFSFYPTNEEWEIIEGGQRDWREKEYRVGRSVWMVESSTFDFFVDRDEGEEENGQLVLSLKNGLELF